jgi:hypothetical protein
MDPKNSFLVPCTECPVEVPDGPFQRGSIWGQPDIDAAVEFMRRVVGNREEARRVGELGRGTVLRKLTAAAVAEGLRDSLLAVPADRAPPLFGAGN